MRVLSRGERFTIDGNPNVEENGGYIGLAAHHCVACVANHCAYPHWNAKLEPFSWASPNLIFPDNLQAMECCILMSREIIEKDHQILINYETVYGHNVNEPHVPFTP